MKKSVFYFIIFGIIFGFGGIMGVNADSTVLYNNGTLIINELTADRTTNVDKYGAVVEVYQAFDANTQNSYVFEKAEDVLWYTNRTKVTQVKIGQEISPTNTAYWFSNLLNAQYGDFSNLDTSKVIDMSYMFYLFGYDNNSSSTSARLNGLSNWDTSKVENMKFLFASCNASIGDLSNWNVSKVTNMDSMFKAYAGTIFNIGNLSNWNTSKVTDMSYMFSDINATDFNSIGNFNIYTSKKNGFANNSNAFSGNIIFDISSDSYSTADIGEFANAATNASAIVNIYAKSVNGENAVNRIMNLYGPNGTYSNGNIYAYYKITTIANDNGNYQLLVNDKEENELYAKPGDNIKVVFTPDAGYYCKGIRVYSTEIVTVNNMTFTMPKGSISVEAIVEELPQKINNINAKLSAYNSIKVSWDRVPNASGYKVLYKKSTSNLWSYKYVNSTYTILSNLCIGTKYQVKVIPYATANGEKKYNTETSIIKSVYTLKKLNTPIVSKHSNNYVRVQWNNIIGESGYEIARSKSKTKNFVVVIRADYRYSSAAVRTTKGYTYYYKARAYKTVDGKKVYGPWSNLRSYKLL